MLSIMMFLTSVILPFVLEKLSVLGSEKYSARCFKTLLKSVLYS